MITTAFWRKSLILLSVLQLSQVQVYAQDLKDELNALEDLPEDDLSDSPDLPKEEPKAAQAAQPAEPSAADTGSGDPLDSLPSSDETPPPDDDLPKDNFDVDESEGLEKDL